MVALVRTKDSGRYKAGSTFSAPTSQARVLVALGHAKPAPKVAAKPKKKPESGQYMRRDMTVEPRSGASVKTALTFAESNYALRKTSDDTE